MSGACTGAEDRGVAGTAATPPPQTPGQCIALVIGNAAYPQSPLETPANDARDFAAASQQRRFAVIEKVDYDLRTMKEAFDEFGQRMPGDEAALFFYAGHGAQVQGRNFVVPVGADPKAEAGQLSSSRQP